MTQPLDLLDLQSNPPPPLFNPEEQNTPEWGADDHLIANDLADDLAEDLQTVILPNRVLNVEAVGITDIGTARNHNEDFFMIDNRVTQLIDPEDTQVYNRGLYILCDGMGGHAQGEVASRMAAETLALYFTDLWNEELPSEAEVSEAIYWANQTLYTINESQTRSGSGRMGTTLVLAMLQETQFRFAHVGDSRLYRFTQRHGLEQLTVDHEVGQRDISRGISPEIAYARPDAYQLTQALGPRPENALRPTVQSLLVTEDTVFLLCSDGMTDNALLERYWDSHVSPLLNVRNSFELGLRELVELANTENGHDNITVVGVRVKVAPQKQAPVFGPSASR